MKSNKEEAYAIHMANAGTKIGNKDIVSGRFYLRLLKAYKEHDAKRNLVMQSLFEENKKLKEERDKYMYTLASLADKKRDKEKIKRLKAQISELVLANVNLKNQLRKTIK